MPITTRAVSRCWLTVAALLAALPLAAQQRPAAQPALKGLWEPVSFSEDLEFREVVFVTTDKGWVAGSKGTIIHTKDGGATWDAQMGGDPQATGGNVSLLRFIDEKHGWAVRDGRILRTVDGDAWEDLGAAPTHIHELAMSSPTEGVAAGYVGMGRNPSTIHKTRDGGKTWKPVVMCSVKAMVGGLNREFGCEVTRIQFVTPSVGYLVAKHQCAGMGCEPPPILGKTEDGGESWRFFVGPGDVETVGATDLFFTDEHTGVVRTTDGKLSRTTDGGATWKGLLATAPAYSDLKFADPEVGWVMEQNSNGKMIYTVDGGARWNSREFRFPASTRAWSFPRRDRAYVVGDHGMVFRYSVVPSAQAAPPASHVAPAMPAFASPLDEEVTELDGFFQDLTVLVEQLPDTAASGAATGTAAASPPPAVDGFSQDTFAPTPFIASCCAKPLNRLDVILAAVLQSLPDFLARFKNTNLLVAGLRMLSTMPTQLSDVRSAVREFKSATNKQGAQAALARLGSATSALRQSTQAAFQEEVTP